jgi:uncharacterized membrane protein
MNPTLWAAQILMALLFTLTGTIKLVVPRERLASKMHWAATWPRARIKLLGLAELAGGLGLVLPMATGIAALLTPVAAFCLAILMVGAIRTHQRLGEAFLPAAITAVLCIAIAVGRFVQLS